MSLLYKITGLSALGRMLSSSEHQSAPDTASSRRNFRAVSIECAEDSCAAAKALPQGRFLVGEAPLLPLEDCDLDVCLCIYEHHDDRRTEEERRQQHADEVSVEQRKREGRRKSDWRRLG